MEAERWDQLAVLFEQALALPPGDRAAFLDDACGSDADLRRQLDALLGSDAAAKAYFDNLAEDVFAPTPTHAEVGPSSVHPPPHVGHYKILEKLGGGGMGIVYKALDTKLDRFVALKFLPPALNANEGAKQRFVAEAKAASALDHANICTIHEIGEADDGQLFIAMAYYQGQTLKKKIRQGPLPLDEALDYAVQMARGLEKAHSKGIVHRDVKPANVMITDDGVVKILDFGLAKMADLQLTQTGTTMGTVAYMSPEQTRGEKVDPRTDIWSLGVVLYEILAGTRPFKGEYDQAIIYAILHEEPALVTVLNPDLPPALEHVVAMCLEKQPDLRYATMDDLLADLEVFVQGSQSNLKATLHATRHHATTKRRRVWAGAASGLLLLMALALLIPASRRRLLTATGLGSAPTRTYVAVLPFTSNSPDNQALADGLMHSLTSLVARLEIAEDSLWVVPAGDILQREITTAQQARKTFGVNKVLRGRLEHLGTQTEVVLELEDPDLPRIGGSTTLPGPRDPAFQEKALKALADLLDVGVDHQVRQATSTSRPTTPDAYAFYLQGRGYLQRYDKTGNIDNAIVLFTQAVEEDSLYALALAGLCEATWDKYRQTTDTALAQEALQLCDRVAPLADEQAPVLVTLGSIYLRTGQHKKAEATLRQAQTIEPNNADALRWLGRVYEDLAQHDQAEAAYRQAIALRPNIWIYYYELGLMLGFRGHYREALEQFEQVRRLTPDNYLGYTSLASIQLLLNQVEEARRLFRRSIALQPNALAYRNLGRLYFRDEQYPEAVQALEQACAENEDDLVAWNWLGHASYWAGNPTKARIAWQHLIEQAEPKLKINPKDDVSLYLLADAHVVLGDTEQGSFYLQRLLALPQEDLLMKYHIGRTYEVLGQRDIALDWIEQVLEEGFDPVTPDRDPWLEMLRQEARYQDLRKRFLEATEKSAT